MTFASSIETMQIHDRQIARIAKIHGPASGDDLPAAGCINRATVSVPRGV